MTHLPADPFTLSVLATLAFALVVWAWYSSLHICFLEEENELLRESLIKLTLNNAVSSNKDVTC